MSLGLLPKLADLERAKRRKTMKKSEIAYRINDIIYQISLIGKDLIDKGILDDDDLETLHKLEEALDLD